ncbi:hypothetical protein OE88DRAFT_900941 [Heliocybe sulcata]|uniref:Uncharacterized protein n=1 Tax=Heliocybe sulcata TaxID=5364 RepID=A0A5C3MYF8_9AGAM|nr:hypothetical protein OE88DRAFT_900941 [Heliocybe sulcata]
MKLLRTGQRNRAKIDRCGLRERRLLCAERRSTFQKETKIRNERVSEGNVGRRVAPNNSFPLHLSIAAHGSVTESINLGSHEHRGGGERSSSGEAYLCYGQHTMTIKPKGAENINRKETSEVGDEDRPNLLAKALIKRYEVHRMGGYPTKFVTSQAYPY